MEIMGVDMTEWTPLSTMILGAALIVVWGTFGKRDD